MNETTIEKMIHGGLGLAHLDSGQVIMIPGALPEEQLIVTIQEKKKNFSLAEITQILHPHPQRITPECLYRKCGGCDFNHAEYDLQLACKEMVIDDLLGRAGLGFSQQRKAIVRSEHHLNYRQRIRLQCSGERIGFRAYRSHELIEIERCLLASNEINETLAELRNSIHARHLIALAEELEIWLNPDGGDVLLLFHFTRKPRPADIDKAQKLVEKLSFVKRIFFTGKEFAMTGPIPAQGGHLLGYNYNDVGANKLKLHYQFEIGGFCQVNLLQNRAMIEKVLQFAKTPPTVLDLFCGMGNFSIPLALLGAEVLGIEGQGGAIRSARRNAELASVTNAEYQKAPVHKACEQLIKSGRTFHTTIIDPPRQGAPGLAQSLAKLTEKQLIYISCDPATLIRDINELMEHGFSVCTFQPVDMFPQTHHIETIVHLLKQ